MCDQLAVAVFVLCADAFPNIPCKKFPESAPDTALSTLRVVSEILSDATFAALSATLFRLSNNPIKKPPA